MPDDPPSSAKLIIERERRFQALSAQARELDIRLAVLPGEDNFEGAPLYQPIDLVSGTPMLGAGSASSMLRSLEEVDAFLAAQVGELP